MHDGDGGVWVAAGIAVGVLGAAASGNCRPHILMHRTIISRQLRNEMPSLRIEFQPNKTGKEQ
jgi:hypothetical protein